MRRKNGITFSDKLTDNLLCRIRNQQIPTPRHGMRNITSITYGLCRKNGSLLAGRRQLQ